MEIENLFRYTALAVGLKPSASQGEARLRGLYRIIYSKTIISVAAWGARLRECSTPSIGFSLCENCSTFRRISLVDHKRATWTPGPLHYPLFCENDAMPK